MKKSVVFLFAVIMFVNYCTAQVQRVTETIGGHATRGYTGDGGPARYASMSYPVDVTSDAAGNIYAADQNGTRIRKINERDGIITTIGGGGTTFADGVPATASTIATDHICADAAGNIFIVYHSSVRKIDAVSGIITTIAGSSTSGYSGDGGPATLALFSSIAGICTDRAGNIYVTDRSNNRVREIDALSGIVTTIAGTGLVGHTGDAGPAVAARLSSPSYITASASGDIIFMDGVSFGYFRKIDAVTHNISTYTMVSSDHSMILDLYGSSGLCAGGNDIYFDEISCSCRGMDLSTSNVTWVGGNYVIESFADDTTSVYAYMNENQGMCTDAPNNIYIADEYNHRVRKLLNMTHVPTFAFGHGQSMWSCAGGTNQIDSLLWVTTMDLGVTETWSVVTPPVYGTLSGFPATGVSRGSFSSLKSHGLNYTAPVVFTTQDHFSVRVSDGSHADTITIYVNPRTDSLFITSTISGSDHVCTGSSIALLESVAGGTWTTIGPEAIVDASGIVTGITAGTAVISYSTSALAGCHTSAAFTVSVLPIPSTGTVDGPVSVCVGSTARLVGINPGGTWVASNANASLVGDTLVYGAASGTDALYYTITDGTCTSSTTVDVVVEMFPDPGVITGGTNVCPGATLTLTDIIPGGIWGVNNSNANIDLLGALTGVTPGNVKVTYKVYNVCGIAYAESIVTVANCTEEVSTNVSVNPGLISVFPNPASTGVKVEWNAPGNLMGTVSITDMAGRKLITEDIESGTQHTKALNIEQLPGGVYLFRLDASGVHYTDKLVINR